MNHDNSDTSRRRAAPRPELPTALSQRGTLSRQKVLSAAIEVIDTGGVQAFTMRRVADQLGVEPMALYHYCTGREELLDGVVDRVVDDLLDDFPVDVDTENWRDFLLRIAHHIRRTALAHPLLFPLIATRGSAAPGVWPPLRSMLWRQQILDHLHWGGFTGQASRQAYREFCGFLIGYLLLEIFPEQPGAAGDPPDPTGAPPRTGVRNSITAVDRPQGDFRESLYRLIDRIDLLNRRIVSSAH